MRILERSLLALLCACATPDSTPARPRVDAGAAPSVAAASTLAPTEGPWLQHLSGTDGKLVADYSPPLGAIDPRPVVVALHGGGDAPEFACGEWRGTFGPWPFILCPYGAPVGKKLYGWGSGAQARRAAEDALVALQARYPQHVDLRDPVLAGFSLGSMTAPAALAQPGATTFPAAVLVEGHIKTFAGYAKKMEAGGLTRLLFVDSQGGNAERAKADVRAMQRATAVQARAIYIGHLGHGFFPKTAKGVREGMAELLSELPGWARYPYPRVEEN